MTIVAAPQPARPKPPYKAPCNRCGLCCATQCCWESKLLFKDDAVPCPALEWTPDGSAQCGLMVNPARYAPTRTRMKGASALTRAMKTLQGAGRGCTMPDDHADPGWTTGRASGTEAFRARRLWGFPTEATPSLMHRDRLAGVFAYVGSNLTAATTLVVHGAAPGILMGQPGRQTHDLNVWEFDAWADQSELRRLFRDDGLEFYVGAEKHDDMLRDCYIYFAERGVSAEIWRRPFVHVQGRCGLVDFPVRRLGEYGNLTVLMPDRPLLVALKLVRGSAQDLADARWWMTEFAVVVDEVRAAVAMLPDARDRDPAYMSLERMAAVMKKDQTHGRGKATVADLHSLSSHQRHHAEPDLDGRRAAPGRPGVGQRSAP